MAIKPVVLDFTNVKEGGGRFSRTHKQPGDYLATVSKVEAVQKKDGSGTQWLFTIKIGAATYPYYCQLEENVLWKVRGLFAAAGVNIPSKRVKLGPDRIVGKKIGVTLDDHEYEGRLMSEILAVFPTSELAGTVEDTEDEEEEEEEEEDEETEEEDETEEEEEDEEEEEEQEPEPPKAKKKGKGKQKTRRKAQVDEDELEELDIEDI